MNKIDIFIPCLGDDVQQGDELYQSLQSPVTNEVYFLSGGVAPAAKGNYAFLPVNSFYSSETFRMIGKTARAEYTLIKLGTSRAEWNDKGLERFYQIARQSQAGICYSDYLEHDGSKTIERRLIDYQPGSLRDNFDFGHFVLLRTDILRTVVEKGNPNYRYAGFYDARLKISLTHPVEHIGEPLYTIKADNSLPEASGHFSYVDPNNRDRQIEMEQACTDYLRHINAYLPYRYQTVDLNSEHFDYEASVIIPVRNRVRTISDAIKSALGQQTSFPFNIIVVDNHSDDGTTEAIRQYAYDKRVIHVIPAHKNLAIGGCWNLALQNPKCGKFAVQLDSDDLYSTHTALQTIVDSFYKKKCGMLIGTYRLTDFELNEIYPGIIDHREWTPENGPNNALRINGLGAPRAFYTPLIREVMFPNTSYGEDYAVGLYFSRKQLIGRVYEVLYNCRRWEENSDAALSMEKANSYNHYKDKLRRWEIAARIHYNNEIKDNLLDKKALSEFQLSKLCHPNALLKEKAESLLIMQREKWQLMTENYRAIEDRAKERLIKVSGINVRLLYNPQRIHSTTAPNDKETIAKRKCFLCLENLPEEQKGVLFKDRYIILCNPYPIFNKHFVIAEHHHLPQKISGRLKDMLDLAKEFDNYVVYYNGANVGASAPDHFHFHAVEKHNLPLCKRNTIKNIKKRHDLSSVEGENDKFCYFLGNKKELLIEQVSEAINSLPICESELEPRFNLLCWSIDPREGECGWVVTLFPRRRHRPKEYYKDGKERVLVSPGALEMAGVFIFPLEEDFRKIKPKDLINIYRQL